MKGITIVLALLCIATYSTQAQTTMTVEQLDSLCLSMSDEVRSGTPIEVTDGTIATRPMENGFVAYLHNAYYTNGKKNRTAMLKQTEEGVLLRLAEGKLCIEEAESRYCKTKYLLPTKMVETECFFLNHQLVKISFTYGNTDYNALPQNYWITIVQLDFVYHKTEPEKKIIYHLSNHIPPVHRGIYPNDVLANDEWREMAMSSNNITEEQLKAEAYRLYGLFIFHKSLFGYQDSR